MPLVTVSSVAKGSSIVVKILTGMLSPPHRDVRTSPGPHRDCRGRNDAHGIRRLATQAASVKQACRRRGAIALGYL
jgi:membrane protein required for beta-lactamase induction